MSRGRSVVSTVLLTTVVIWVVIFGGWFVATRYLREPVVETPTDEAANKPAPRRRAPRRSKTNAPGSAQDGQATTGTAPEEQATESAPASAGGQDGAAAGQAAGGAPSQGVPGERDQGESSTAAAPATAARSGEDDDARAIVVESERRTDAQSHHYEGLLQMFDASEKVTEKRWTFDRLGSRGQSKVVLRFTAPAEVKGVALLIVNHESRASDQWMWTPAIERDRRIALQDRSTRFFGTDFSFEDLEERDVDQFDYVLIGKDTAEGAECWTIQSTPKTGKSSQYSRSIVWIRKDNYALARLDNYVGNAVVKRLNYSKIDNIQGIWTARQLDMNDLRRRSRTRLTLQQVSYNAPAKEMDFTLQAIKRQ